VTPPCGLEGAGTTYRATKSGPRRH